MKFSVVNIFVSIFVLLSPVLVMSPVDAQAADQIKSIIRNASKECRTAKNLRRSDLDQAKQHFAKYVRLLNQAIALKPDLLDSPDASTQRVLDFCNVVKDDLDRAEAIPLLERGLRECGEARVMISNAAFDDAREKHRLYQEYKGGALAISESVLVVYRNSYEIRICDRLEEDIAQAEQDYQEELQKAAQAESQNLFQGVIDNLNQAMRQCQGARNLISDSEGYSRQTLDQVKNLSKDAADIVKSAIADRDKLIAEGKQPDQAVASKINGILGEVKDCQGAVPAGVKNMQLALAARTNVKNVSGSSRVRPAAPVNRDFRQIVGAPASYPRRAIRRGIEGVVQVRFTITKTGDVVNPEIIKAEPEGWFEKSVLAAVKKYKFQPRVVNGQPVDVKGVDKRVVFKLE